MINSRNNLPVVIADATLTIDLKCLFDKFNYNTICDQILENHPYGHAWNFEFTTIC